MSAEPSMAEQLRAEAGQHLGKDHHTRSLLRAAADRLEAQQVVIEAAYSVIEADGAGDIGAAVYDLAFALAALNPEVSR